MTVVRYQTVLKNECSTVLKQRERGNNPEREWKLLIVSCPRVSGLALEIKVSRGSRQDDKHGSQEHEVYAMLAISLLGRTES